MPARPATSEPRRSIESPSPQNDPPSSSRPTWVRILVPAILVLAWLAIGGVGGPYFGKISDVTTNDQATFLPESAESTKVSEVSTEFYGSDAIPAIVLFQRDGGLTDADQDYIDGASDRIAGYGLTDEEISPAIPSEDGEAAQVVVPLGDEDTVAEDVGSLRTSLEADTPDGLNVHVTGPAGFTAELLEGFAGIDGLLLIVALAVVLVILLIVYRSPILPLVVLTTSMLALCAAILVVYWMASNGWVEVNGQVQGILFILVVGAATDYGLLYVARYRDALRTIPHKWDATYVAVKGTMEPILASSSTVIAGLLCLLLSDLASNRALGPVATVGIVMSVLSALTFLPAVLSLFGRTAFWPSRPRYSPDDPERFHLEDADPQLGRKGRPAIHGKGLWPAVARFVTRAPRTIWISCVVLLALGAALSPQFRAEGVAESELVLGEAPAADGQVVLAEHFPGGSGSPAQILAPEGRLDEVANAVSEIEGVESVAARAIDSPSGTRPVGPDAEAALEDALEQAAAQGPPPGAGAPDGAGPPPGVTEGEGAPGADGTEDLTPQQQAEALPDEFNPLAADPTVVDGNVLVEATLVDTADSQAAFDTIDAIRTEVHAIDQDIAVGGSTATSMDTLETAQRDRAVIIPVILAVITVILALLLRSLLAPILLVITTVLSYLTALGVSAVIFNDILDFPGADPSVALYGFVFLVALGIDYNIFLMSRVREESLDHGTRSGVLRALVVTGGVITSAGIVLAATFGALAVIPIIFLVQLAILVAFGVLLDALLVRSLLVPALVYDLGKVIWWPSGLWRRDRGAGRGDREDPDEDRADEHRADERRADEDRSIAGSATDAQPRRAIEDDAQASAAEGGSSTTSR